MVSCGILWYLEVFGLNNMSTNKVSFDDNPIVNATFFIKFYSLRAIKDLAKERNHKPTTTKMYVVALIHLTTAMKISCPPGVRYSYQQLNRFHLYLQSELQGLQRPCAERGALIKEGIAGM